MIALHDKDIGISNLRRSKMFDESFHSILRHLFLLQLLDSHGR